MGSGDGDGLAAALARELATRGRQVLHLAGRSLVDAVLSIRGERLSVNDLPVDGVAFLAPPTSLARGLLEPSDDAFVAAEARALWLAALQLESVTVVNRYDADAWFRGAGWPVWRSRLRAAGVPVCPLAVGGAGRGDWSWLPWTSVRPRAMDSAAGFFMAAAAVSAAVPSQHLIVRGRSMGRGTPLPPRLAAALSAHGIELAEVWLDAKGRVVAVDPAPAPADPDVVAAAADLLADVFA